MMCAGKLINSIKYTEFALWKSFYICTWSLNFRTFGRNNRGFLDDDLARKMQHNCYVNWNYGKWKGKRILPIHMNTLCIWHLICKTHTGTYVNTACVHTFSPKYTDIIEIMSTFRKRVLLWTSTNVCLVSVQ